MICIVFIFVYALGYSLGFGPASWVYNTEVSGPPLPPSSSVCGLDRLASRCVSLRLIASRCVSVSLVQTH